MTLKSLLQQLAQEGHFLPENISHMPTLLAHVEKGTPWYIKIAYGITAWVASLCLLCFIVYGAVLVEEAIGFMVLGLFLVIVASSLKWAFRHSIFVGQMGLAFSLAGQGLFAGGVMMQSEDLTTTALVVIGLQIGLIFGYPDMIHRLWSMWVIIKMILLIVVCEWEIYNATHALVIILAALSLLLWMNDFNLIPSAYLTAIIRPVGYGMALAMLGILILSVLVNKTSIDQWWISSVGLWLVLLVLTLLIIFQPELDISNLVGSIILIGLTLLLILTWQAPGILGGLLILLLGFWRGNRLLTGLAITFGIFFIAGFYYNLELDLQQKSFILMGSGAVFLLIRQLLIPKSNQLVKEA